MAPPPHFCARLHENGMSHMAGTAVSASLQSWSDQCWVDMGFARSMWRCQRGCEDGRARVLTPYDVLVDGPLWLAPQ